MPDKKKDKKAEPEAGPPNGTFVFPNGDRYTGEYLINDNVLERSGKGIHTTSEGIVYDGQWSGDKMNGLGRLSFPSSAWYEGEFVNNKFHGKGTFSFANGSLYVGDFVDNKLMGNGQFRDTEGQAWTGDFMGRAAPGLRFKLELD